MNRQSDNSSKCKRAFARAALCFTMLFLLLFTGLNYRTAAAEDAGSKSPGDIIAEAKRAFNEDMRRARKDFDEAIRKAKQDYQLAVKKARQDSKAVKDETAKQAREIRQSSDEAVKAAKAEYKRTRQSARQEWMKAKETAKKKYRETVSRN